MENMDKLWHLLALKHLKEKFLLELFLDPNISLDNLINDYHNVEVFKHQEYMNIYEECMNEVKEKTIEDIYDIINYR